MRAIRRRPTGISDVNIARYAEAALTPEMDDAA
jgi:hypothetical protein